MNMSEIESNGLADAREVLRKAPQTSVRHLRDVCGRQDTQALDGHRFDSCGFGNLSKGAGHDYTNKTTSEVIEEVVGFAASFGVALDPKVQTPFEKFCMNMTPRKFRLLESVCDEVLAEEPSSMELQSA